MKVKQVFAVPAAAQVLFSCSHTQPQATTATHPAATPALAESEYGKQEPFVPDYEQVMETAPPDSLNGRKCSNRTCFA